MDAQEFQDLKKVSKIWVKNLDPAVNRLNNTVSLMISMKPKDAIKLDTVPLEKNIQKKPYYPKMDCIDVFINLVNNMDTKKTSNRSCLE